MARGLDPAEYIEPPGRDQPYPGAPEDEGTQPTPGENPLLDKFKGIFTTPEAEEWGPGAATILNDYAQRRAVAEANQAAGEVLVNHISGFQNGLVGMVSADPFALHTALDLVRPTIGSLIGADPEHPDEQRGDTFDRTSREMETAIARQAVTSLAERHDGAAREMLADPRLANLLDDEDRDGLSSYIDMAKLARDADGLAQQQRMAEQRRQVEAGTTLGYAAALYDPQSDSVQFKPGWAQRIMGDPRVGPQDKADLMDLYGRLQTAGDAPDSDPFLVAQLLSDAAAGVAVPHSEIVRSAGISLRLADAAQLGAGSGPLTPGQRSQYGYLANAVEAGRAALMGRDGENGAAGYQAFARYVNWLLPASRQGGLSFEEGAPGNPLMMLGQFRPTGDDLLMVRGRLYPRNESLKPSNKEEWNPEPDVRLGIPWGNRQAQTGDKAFEIESPRGDIRDDNLPPLPKRPSLDAIFGRRVASRSGTVDDTGNVDDLLKNYPSRNEFGEPRDAEMSVSPKFGNSDAEILIVPNGLGPARRTVKDI